MEVVHLEDDDHHESNGHHQPVKQLSAVKLLQADRLEPKRGGRGRIWVTVVNLYTYYSYARRVGVGDNSIPVSRNTGCLVTRVKNNKLPYRAAE